MTDKKFEKIEKLLGQETITEMNGLDKDSLTKVIVDAESAMEVVQRELDENEEYQRVKQAKTDLESSKKAVNARQRARIAYALERLKELGQQ